MRWLAVSLALGVAGCATSAAQRSSGDPAATARRDLSELAALRASGHVDAAVAGLDRLLKRLAAAGGVGTLSPETRASLDAELGAARAFAKEIGAKELASGHPLAAEAELARRSPLLSAAELAPARQEAAARIRLAGQQSCSRLRESPQTPNWTVLVARYCSHFGDGAAPSPSASAPPALAVSGTISGLARPQVDLVHARAAEWFRATLWTRVADAAAARAAVAGTFESTFRQSTVTLHAPYEETVTTHTKAEPRPAPLFVGDAVVAALGGTGKRDGKRDTVVVTPNTVSTATTNRVFEYDAEESRGHYGLDARVTFELDPGGPTIVELRRTEDLKAYEHDVTFAPAQISPKHDKAPSGADWLQGQLDKAARSAHATLNGRFVATFCARASYPPEDAARCFVAGQRPPAAMQTLTAAFGDDEQRLAAVLAPPAPPRPKEPAARPARPRRARPAHSGATDQEDPAAE